MIGACNDCGSPADSLEDVKVHAKTAHPGMGRYRFWDGQVETIDFEPEALAAELAKLEASLAKVLGRAVKLQVS